MIPTIKVCTKCQEHKLIFDFNHDRQKWNGRSSWCNECQSKQSKKWRGRNQSYVLKKAKEYAEKNRNKYLAYQKKYREEHKAELNIYFKKRNIEKKDQIRISRKPNYKKRYRNDPKYRLNNQLSCAIRRQLKNGKEGNHWECLVGFTLKQLMKHLEKQFKPGMTWKNYGSEWHIDHIIPLSVFNFTSYKHIDFKRCWALTNLQPLWKQENLDKKDNLYQPFQPALGF